jgi:hypothetical protein
MTLAETIQAKILTGELPNKKFVRTWYGRGERHPCSACAFPVTTNQIEVEGTWWRRAGPTDFTTTVSISGGPRLTRTKLPSLGPRVGRTAPSSFAAGKILRVPEGITGRTEAPSFAKTRRSGRHTS